MAGVAGIRGAGPMPLNGQLAPLPLPQWFGGGQPNRMTPGSHSTNQGEVTHSHNYRPGAQVSDISAIPLTKEAYGAGFHMHGKAMPGHYCFLGTDREDNSNSVVPTSLAALNSALRVPDNALNNTNYASEVLKVWRPMGATLNMGHSPHRLNRQDGMHRTTVKGQGDVYDMPLYWAAEPGACDNLNQKIGHHLWFVLMKVKQRTGVIEAGSLDLNRRSDAASHQESLQDHSQNDLAQMELLTDQDEKASYSSSGRSSNRDYCWQFLPHMTPGPEPPTGLLHFIPRSDGSQPGEVVVGGYVPVGILTRDLTSAGGGSCNSFAQSARVVCGLEDSDNFAYHDQQLPRVEVNLRSQKGL